MFWNADGKALELQGILRGFPAFLILNGPSFNQMDKTQLTRPGVLTMGVNNGPAAFRPDLWTMGDDVTNFVRSIYLDPTITKFVPRPKMDHRVFNNDLWRHMDVTVGQCPNVVGFERDEEFTPETFLTKQRFIWGNHSDRCICGFMRPKPGEGEKKIKVCPKCKSKRFGCRSIMFLAIRILYELGVRTLYLLGADFRMEKGYTYSFQQGRAKQSINNNNSYYAEMNIRFDALRPVFERAKFNVYNCTPESGLKSFDYMPFDEAIAFATKALPPADRDDGVWLCRERTEGLYERKSLLKKAAEGKLTMAELKAVKRRS